MRSKTKHVVMYSGGVISFLAAKRVVAKRRRRNTFLLFTDTLIEDEDLYRFLIESAIVLYQVDGSDFLKRLEQLPKVSHETMQDRKAFLMEMAQDINDTYPFFRWETDGRDPWDVFKDSRWIGNSRRAPCSHVLKQELAQKYVRETYSSDNTTIYLGLDWHEKHRMGKPKKEWAPYGVDFPMSYDPYYMRSECFKLVEDMGIKVPRLYEQGFTHNNCGGFCVRAGQASFIRLYLVNRELFMYHEDKEQELRDMLGRNDISIMTRMDRGKKYPLTLRELREQYEKNTKSVDMDDIGGCGCFVG